MDRVIAGILIIVILLCAPAWLRHHSPTWSAVANETGQRVRANRAQKQIDDLKRKAQAEGRMTSGAPAYVDPDEWVEKVENRTDRHLQFVAPTVSGSVGPGEVKYFKLPIVTAPDGRRTVIFTFGDKNIERVFKK